MDPLFICDTFIIIYIKFSLSLFSNLFQIPCHVTSQITCHLTWYFFKAWCVNTSESYHFETRLFKSATILPDCVPCHVSDHLPCHLACQIFFQGLMCNRLESYHFQTRLFKCATIHARSRAMSCVRSLAMLFGLPDGIIFWGVVTPSSFGMCFVAMLL